MQNEYNDPESQMERYKEAGLNPHLIYGQGTPGNASEMPKYQPAQMDYEKPEIQVPDVADMYYSLRSKKLEQDRIKKTIEVQDAQIANLRTDGLIKSIEALNKDLGLYRDWGINSGISGLEMAPIASGKTDREGNIIPFAPKVYYDLNQAELENELTSKAITKKGAEIKTELGKPKLMETMMEINKLRGELVKVQTEWQGKVNTEYDKKGININKDAIDDRIMTEWLRDLPAAKGWLKTAFPMLKAIFD